MDKLEKQFRDVLGDDAMDALDKLVSNEVGRTINRGKLVGEVMNNLVNQHKDIRDRLEGASKDAGPRELVLVVPPVPTHIGRAPDIGRGLTKSIFIVPLENGDCVMSEGMKEMLEKVGPPIAIDCQMNPDGSLSFGVVPPDTESSTNPWLRHEPWDPTEISRVVDGVKDGTIPHIALDSFSNLDSHSKFEEKKEEK